MPPFSDLAVVLGRLDYSETSQVIVFYTRGAGKVRAIAKGAKRGTKTRFAVGADLLDVGRLVYSARPDRPAVLANVVEFKPTLSLSGLRERIDRLYAAQYCAEITAHLTEDGDPHPELFEALVAALTGASTAPEPLAVVVTYLRALLEEIGSLPRFDACMSCARTTDLTHFSSFEGGMICRHCEPNQVEKRELSTAVLQALHAVDEDAPVDSPQQAEGVFAVLNYHVAHLMGRAPLLADKLVPAARQRMI